MDRVYNGFFFFCAKKKNVVWVRYVSQATDELIKDSIFRLKVSYADLLTLKFKLHSPTAEHQMIMDVKTEAKREQQCTESSAWVSS